MGINKEELASMKAQLQKINTKITDVCNDIDKRYNLFNFSLFEKSAKILDKNIKKQKLSPIIKVNGEDTTISKLEKDVKTYKEILNKMRKKKYFSYITASYVREFSSFTKGGNGTQDSLKEAYKKCIDMIDNEYSKAKEYYKTCTDGFKVVSKATYNIVKENSNMKEGTEMNINDINDYLFESMIDVIDNEEITEGKIIDAITPDATKKALDKCKKVSENHKEYMKKAKEQLKAKDYKGAKRTVENGIKELDALDKELASINVTKKDVNYNYAVGMLVPIATTFLVSATLEKTVNSLFGSDITITYDPSKIPIIKCVSDCISFLRVKKKSKYGVSAQDFVTCVGQVRKTILKLKSELEKLNTKIDKKSSEVKESAEYDMVNVLSEAFVNGDIDVDDMMSILESTGDDDIDTEDITDGEEENIEECGSPDTILLLKKAVENGIISEDQYKLLVACKDEDCCDEEGCKSVEADVCPGCGKSPCVCEDENEDEDEIQPDITDEPEYGDDETPLTQDEYNAKCHELYCACNEGKITLEEREDRLVALKEAYSATNKPTYNTMDEAIAALKKRGFETDIKKRLSENRFGKRDVNSGKILKTAVVNKKGDGKFEITLM